MTKLITSAPGKVMIAGEYSVLFGHRAIVAAIDRIAQCSFNPGPAFEFIAEDGKHSHSNVDHPLFRAAIKAVGLNSYSAHPGTYTINTAAFFNQENGQKLGLGSSAAAMVSLCKMILAQHNVLDRHKILSVAKSAHKDFSSGFGSGADIAASLFGGIISYQQQALDDNQIKPCALLWAWPNFVFVDTRKSQSTQEFLKPVIYLQKNDREFVSDFCKTSETLCKVILDSKCNLSSLISVIRELYLLLNTLTSRAGIDIISKEHKAIHECAALHEGSAKPSGAGGGDIALAVVPESNQEAFIKEIAKLGFLPLQLRYST